MFKYLYICLESADMISPPNCFAILTASADLPVAVGPAMTMRFSLYMPFIFYARHKNTLLGNRAHFESYSCIFSDWRNFSNFFEPLSPFSRSLTLTVFDFFSLSPTTRR